MKQNANSLDKTAEACEMDVLLKNAARLRALVWHLPSGAAPKDDAGEKVAAKIRAIIQGHAI